MHPISTIAYGAPPVDLGPISIDPVEMLLYLYLPVKMVHSDELRLPERVDFLEELIQNAISDARKTLNIDEHYVYLTAKTMWVGGAFSGNRPGWHADGYGSNGDLNYIWHSMNPTEFAVQEFRNIPDDDLASMAALEAQIDCNKIAIFPNGHLLRLDESVVHRVNPNVQSGMRTFVKVSVSKNRFNLKMNSHNYLFDYDWMMYDRGEVRNIDSNKDFVPQ